MNPASEQLHGWKEIANHLGRSVRCVQRWGKNERLPVRRHGHRGGASVYAFRKELDAWWQEERPGCKGHSGELESLHGKRDKETKPQAAPVTGRDMRMEADSGHLDNQNHHAVEQLAREAAILLFTMLKTLAACQVSKGETRYLRGIPSGPT